MGLMAFVLSNVKGPVKTWYVEDDGQIAFRQFLRTDIADEGEAVAVLEVGLGDDITLKSWRSWSAVVASITQGED